MGYDITIARISNDFKTTEKISKEDWINCSIPKELEFIEKETYPKYYLELKNVLAEDFIPCFWISNDFQNASVDSSVFLMTDELDRFIIHIASQIEGIVFGQEGELYFIPNYGKIETDKKLMEQELVTIQELNINGITVNDQTSIRQYINLKLKKASS